MSKVRIYIGDLPLLKSLDGTAVDEISNGILTRRVDSDGSVLPTPTTTQITMPSIPTTEGANSITVDTTVQPSEFTATWTGWHDAEVKEKSENLLDTSGAVQGYLGNDGTIGQSTAYYTTDYIPIKSETDYRYTLTSNFGGNRLLRVSYYNSSKTFIANSTSSAFGDGEWSAVWQSPANAAYIRLSYINPADPTKADTYKMMSEGGTALPYEPYWK